jgi:hypothetical protein
MARRIIKLREANAQTAAVHFFLGLFDAKVILDAEADIT